MKRNELAKALLETPIFVGNSHNTPEIHGVSERDGLEFTIKEVRYNHNKGIIELVLQP